MPLLPWITHCPLMGADLPTKGAINSRFSSSGPERAAELPPKRPAAAPGTEAPLRFGATGWCAAWGGGRSWRSAPCFRCASAGAGTAAASGSSLAPICSSDLQTKCLTHLCMALIAPSLVAVPAWRIPSLPKKGSVFLPNDVFGCLTRARACVCVQGRMCPKTDAQLQLGRRCAWLRSHPFLF